MLYVFTGADPIAVRARAHTFVDGYEEQGSRVERLTAEECSADLLRDRATAQSLFLSTTDREPAVIVLDTPSEKATAQEVVVTLAPVLAESSHVFVLIEQKLLVIPTRELKKYATEYHEIAGSDVTEKFNVFSLADALARRDRKSLWILLLRAGQAGLSPEEIIGTLFWQIKTMRLVTQTKNAEEAGLKPFVYTKAKRAVEKFTRDELTDVSRQLVTLYHEGHLGNVDMTYALERWVLSL